ncbi:MAG: DNA topology modulation protein FlaR [Woeseiaceae bacterium]
MIIGGAGSGKSTLAVQLGELTELPVVHIDPMYWKPGWVQREHAETEAMVHEAIAADKWIFEGNNSKTFQSRLARADTLVFLDISMPRRLWRVLKRTISSYGKVRPDMAEGCPEQFDFSFLLWVIDYARRGSRDVAINLLKSAPDDVDVHHLRKPSHVKMFLNAVQ